MCREACAYCCSVFAGRRQRRERSFTEFLLITFHTFRHTMFHRRPRTKMYGRHTLRPRNISICNLRSGATSFQYASCEETDPKPGASCTLDNETLTDGSSQTFYSSRTTPFGSLCPAFGISRTCADGTLSGQSAYQFASCTVAEPASCSQGGVTTLHGQSSSFYSSQSVSFGQQCNSQLRSCSNGTLSGSASFQYGSCTVGQPASCTLDNTTVQHGSSQSFYSSRTVAYGALCSSVAQSRSCSNGTFNGSNSYLYATCATAVPAACTFNGQSVAHGASVTAYQAAS